jgi:hypothetical protein
MDSNDNIYTMTLTKKACNSWNDKPAGCGHVNTKTLVNTYMQLADKQW